MPNMARFWLIEREELSFTLWTHHTAMNKVSPAVALYPRTPHSLLLARYVAGQIDDPAWSEIMNIMDAAGPSPSERAALADFLNDAVCELGPTAIKVPQIEEVEEFLTYTRAA